MSIYKTKTKFEEMDEFIAGLIVAIMVSIILALAIDGMLADTTDPAYGKKFTQQR